jgi:hypothetical protein
MKVIINSCYGGFSLSDVAMEEIKKLNPELGSLYCRDDNLRTDPIVISVVERLGKKANGEFAKLEIIEIPFEDSEGWYIDEYDGMETIRENHRSW